MTKHEYSVEEVREQSRLEDGGSTLTQDMLRAYAEILEQIERAKDGVTDEVAKKVCAEYERLGANSIYFKPSPLAIKYMRTSLQAVAHLLPSDLVVTTNEAGQIVAVTRQDDEGRILEVIAESPANQPRVPDGDHYENKWFVITGNNEAETPILVFTSRGMAEQYCSLNPNPKGYRVYAAASPQPKESK